MKTFLFLGLFEIILAANFNWKISGLMEQICFVDAHGWFLFSIYKIYIGIIQIPNYCLGNIADQTIRAAALSVIDRTRAF